MVVTTIELIDRFQALLQLESTIYSFDDYMSPSTQLMHNYEHARHCQDKRYWRTRVIGWMYSVVDRHMLNRELVYVAMSYLDRYLSKHLLVNDSHTYQLVGMTSLYMALKLYRNKGKAASMSSFVKLSQGSCTKDDFLNMEQRILDTLDWRMHPPTPQSYLELLMFFLPKAACSPFTRRALFERIKFLLELSVTVRFFFGKKPSSIATAAFIEVMEHEKEPNVSKQSWRAHFRYCARSIAGIYCDAEEVVECCDAMKAVHKNAWHQMNSDVMNERDYTTSSPVANKKQVSVVSP